MRHSGKCFIALLFALCIPVLIWIGAGSALYSVYRGKKKQRLAEMIQNLTCSIDTDCPPGMICISGRCVPAD